jgi:hypothetical protein
MGQQSSEKNIHQRGSRVKWGEAPESTAWVRGRSRVAAEPSEVDRAVQHCCCPRGLGVGFPYNDPAACDEAIRESGAGGAGCRKCRQPVGLSKSLSAGAFPGRLSTGRHFRQPWGCLSTRRATARRRTTVQSGRGSRSSANDNTLWRLPLASSQRIRQRLRNLTGRAIRAMDSSTPPPVNPKSLATPMATNAPGRVQLRPNYLI